MSEITQAQFERVIERLADNNKALHDLVDFHAKENDRLREALFRIADHPVEQSRQWEVGAKEMIRLARMVMNGEFKSPYDALAEENDRMRKFLIAVSRAARKMGDDDLADDCCAALGEGKE